jgi:hypothetical protein
MQRCHTGSENPRRDLQITMIKLQVISSELRAAGYDPDEHLLEIEFNNGGVYHYFGVPLDEYSGLMAAPSKGQYFNQRIRNKYDCVRIGSPQTEST